MATTQVSLEEIDRGGSRSAHRTQIVLSWGHSEFAVAPESAHLSVRHASFDELSDVAAAIKEAGSPAHFTASSGAKVVHVFGPDFDEILNDLQSVIDDPETDCEMLVIDGIESIGATHREVRERLTQIRDILSSHGILIAFIEADPTGSEIHPVDPASDKFDWVLRTLLLSDQASLSRQREAMKQDVACWAGLEYNGGRPGLGFKTVDGDIVPGPRYEEVCACLELVAEGEMSKRQAAAHLNTSSRTITRCIEERPERYGLQT